MKAFKSKKHKKKVNHLILFTTDAAESKVRQIRLAPWTFRTLVLLFCIIAGVLTGYFVYGGTLYHEVLQRQAEQKVTIENLELEKEQVLAENEALNEKVAILSETVNQKVQEEKEAAARTEEMSLPKEFPLTGSAQVEETTVGEIKKSQMVGEFQRIGDEKEEQNEKDAQPVSVFTASEGTMAVASGTGNVVQVGEDVLYGYKVVIDHGNGYTSIYLNKSEPKVKEGDAVSPGDVLYIIDSESTTLGYQITKDGVYINPMEMIAISG